VITKSIGTLKRNTSHQEFHPLSSCIPTQQEGTTLTCFDGVAQSNGRFDGVAQSNGQHCGVGGL